MSHYDNGLHSYTGMTTINLTLETYNNRIGMFWKRRFNSEQSRSLSLLGGKFYMQTLEFYPLTPTLEKFKLKLISSGPIKYTKGKLEDLKKKCGNITLDIHTDVIKANSYPGWVHDWIRSLCLDKKNRIWSEARDTIQNDKYLYEVEWYQTYDYWCSDCHDEHTEKKILLTKFYKSKKIALRESKTMPKEIEGNIK